MFAVVEKVQKINLNGRKDFTPKSQRANC